MRNQKAIALRIDQDFYVACVGDCGALTREQINGRQAYRNISTPSLINLTHADELRLSAPIGFLLHEQNTPEPMTFVPGTSAISASFNIEPVRISLGTESDWIILTSHKLYHNEQHTETMLKKLVLQTTVHATLQYLCESEGADWDECMAVASYLGQ